ncbi:Detected protein of confused Function [Hibiscus syriacus]|uniref:Detected protein of confused Function n=1 Tax=Hibiscus syriacus TaxID=106335 RepID=A0A6A3BGF4_HIBSY|nr:Detected protein of confused Function [Hibiscus syriacus]
MELFTSGREAFPQHVAPFPDLTAMIESAEDMVMDNHRPNLPPQKLRPIRYNGRSQASSQAEDPLEFVEAVELVGDDVCAVNGDSFDYLVPPIKAEVGDVMGTVGCGGGGLEEPPSSEQREEPSGKSSSDSYGDDSSATLNAPLKKNRKRKRTEKDEIFLEKLMKKMMDKQEQMHKQLLEMVEKRERERINREEAWKRQEMERIKRDEEARAQEMSRSIALISFIQNALGHEIEIPMPSTMSCTEENGGKDLSEDHIQKDLINPFGPTNNRWQKGTMQANVVEKHVDGDGGVICDPNNRRWPDAEVQALIMLRSTLEHKFHVSGSKCSIWDEISVGMYNMGYSRSAKKCKEKWENINKYFRKSMVSGKKHLENSKRCAYFHDLHMLYKNGFSSQVNHLNCTKVENADNGESLKGNKC